MNPNNPIWPKTGRNPPNSLLPCWAIWR